MCSPKRWTDCILQEVRNNNIYKPHFQNQIKIKHKKTADEVMCYLCRQVLFVAYMARVWGSIKCFSLLQNLQGWSDFKLEASPLCSWTPLKFVFFAVFYPSVRYINVVCLACDIFVNIVNDSISSLKIYLIRFKRFNIMFKSQIILDKLKLGLFGSNSKTVYSIK